MPPSLVALSLWQRWQACPSRVCGLAGGLAREVPFSSSPCLVVLRGEGFPLSQSATEYDT